MFDLILRGQDMKSKGSMNELPVIELHYRFLVVTYIGSHLCNFNWQ